MPAIGEPGRAVRPDNDAVRGSIFAKGDALDVTAVRIEAAGDAGLLPGEPDLALGTNGNVVR